MSVSRPASARPRQDPEHPQAPISDEERLAIEDDRIGWTRLLGATVEDFGTLGGRLVTHSAPGSSLNFFCAIRWPGDAAADRLEGVVELMSERNVWPSVIVCDDLTTPADLAERLRTAGWVAVSSERIMWTRHAAVVPHLDAELRVEAVTPNSALECVRLETDVFALMPEHVGESAELLAQSVAAGTTRAFLLRLRGEPVASARLVPGNKVAALHAIGVAALQRRRGYGRMLTAVATRAGLATGHSLVWLSVDESNTAAVDLYRSLGFEPSLRWTRWLAPA
jgi:ribosomal protein S18 acetylase RimI-like enzyme